jgi:polysaccharide export outer membrane protein
MPLMSRSTRRRDSISRGRETLLDMGAGLVILLLSACTVVPGSNMSAGVSGNSWFGEDKDELAELPDIVKLHSITTAILLPATQEGSSSSVSTMPPEEESEYEYLVGAGDVLNVTVWDHPELTIPAGSLRSAAESGNWVHADGSIFYPYVGRIEVAGLDVTEIRDLITQRISKYIESPQVDVTVASFRSQRVYVTGEVAQPGAVPITNIPMRLIDAVNVVGGLSKFADWRKVTLTRDGVETTYSLQALYQKGDASQNILLTNNDVLNVGSNEDNKVFVLGEVKEARSVFMTRNGLSLAGALSDTGGLNEMTSNARGVFVMRRGEKKGEPRIDVYQLNAKNAAALVLADQFELKPRDIIYVTAAPLARWNRVIQQILPTVQTIYYGALAEDRLTDPDN